MNTNTNEIFGDIIAAYTRAEGIADGALVDVSEVAKEAGFKIPVALTAAVARDYMYWTDADTKRQTYQSESGRLWDILYMLFFKIKFNPGAEILLYTFRAVPRGGRGRRARKVQLKAIIGPGDDGRPVVTIMLPEED
jgi:hypothetical protein